MVTAFDDPFAVIPRWEDGQTLLLKDDEWWAHHVTDLKNYEEKKEPHNILKTAPGEEMEEADPDMVHGWLPMGYSPYGEHVKEFMDLAFDAGIELDEGYYVATDTGDGVVFRWEGDWKSTCKGAWSVRSPNMTRNTEGHLEIVKQRDDTALRFEIEGRP